MFPLIILLLRTGRWYSSRTILCCSNGPTSSNEIFPAANLEAVYTYTSRPWNVNEFSEPGRRLIFSSISRTASIPSASLINVKVPLSGVTKYWPDFDFITIDFLAVPTPGSTTETNTVPAGQKGAAWYNL